MTLVRFQQAAEDRCREARIVDLDRDVGVTCLARGQPGRPDFCLAGEDPEVRSLFARFLNRSDGGLGADRERCDRALICGYGHGRR